MNNKNQYISKIVQYEHSRLIKSVIMIVIIDAALLIALFFAYGLVK